MTARRTLSPKRASQRFGFQHDGQPFTATASWFPTGELAEIFLDCHKPGSSLQQITADTAVLCSLLLQHGVAAAEIRHSITGPIATALDQIGGAP